MTHRIKLAGRSLADFALTPKGPTIVDFLQAQDEGRIARQADIEEGILKRAQGHGCLVSRTTLPNGVVHIRVKLP